MTFIKNKPLFPGVIPPNNRVVQQTVRRPVAPPVYRPQPPPKVLQLKNAAVQRPFPPQAPRPALQPNLPKPVRFPAPVTKVVQAHGLGIPARTPATGVVSRAVIMGGFAGGGAVIQPGKSTRGRKRKPPPPPKGARRPPPAKKPRSFKGRRSAPTKKVAPSKLAAGKKKAAPKKKVAQKQATVKLWVNGGKPFEAISSTQYGHAEMSTLKQFIEKIERATTGTPKQKLTAAWNALKNAGAKEVGCPNQAVCGSCSMILKALGFTTRGDTEFSSTKSGGVSWGANIKVKDFLNNIPTIDGESDHIKGKFRGLYDRALAAGAK